LGEREQATVLDILLVDDEPAIRQTLSLALRAQGHRLETAADGAEAMARLDARAFGLVVSDVRLPKVDGFTILRRIVHDAPATDVLLMTAYGTIPDAVVAMRERAADYVTKPFQIEEFVSIVGHIDERRQLKEELRRTREELANIRSMDSITGRSPSATRVREQVHAVADTDAAVLLTGESGTGKELVARTLHELSSRRDKPFVAVNCGAVPTSLIEAELFGHERGAFTGAVRRREGRFASAQGGTLFLDEIGEMAPEAQVKLLRVLQEGTFQAVGSDRTQTADVRLISATNRDLKEQCATGAFRPDLYYRVRVFEIRLAALRDRLTDLPMLIEQFLREYSPPGVRHPGLTPAAWGALSHYPFPGNIRELKHSIQHATILARGGEIDLHHLPPELGGVGAMAQQQSISAGLQETMARHEREYLMRALEVANGERQVAARILGISRKTLWKKLKAFGIFHATAPAEPS
jgi:DNA-binding NtrC family response regulator